MLAGKKRSLSIDSDVSALHKEWDQALCPICIEHPHNAVLLLCSSHGKGCRPYICDTSYRHSNCLDRYRKLHSSPASLEMTEQQDHGNTSAPRSGAHGGDGVFGSVETLNPRGGSTRDRLYSSSHNEDMEIVETEFSMDKTGKMNLKCPLCRGDVQGWKVIEDARNYLNMKTRSCTRESCSFVGNYGELRKHARSLHPSVRPAEVDPSRQRAWSRFEHQREYDDIVSAIQSAIPGSVMFGDYVIEDENFDRIPIESGRTSTELNGSVLTLYLLQMIGSMDSRGQSRGNCSRQRRSSRRRSSGRQSSGRRSSGRRYLWEDNRTRHGNDIDDDGDLNPISTTSDGFPARRRLRRLTRTRYSRDEH